MAEVMKKKILHMIETSGPGGAENMFLSMLDTLDPVRYENHVLLLKEGWLSRKVEDLGIRPFIVAQNGTLDTGWIKKVKKRILETGMEHLHCHEFAMNSYGAILSRMTGIPGVATVHGKNYYGDKLQRRLLYRFASRQLEMVAVSADIADYLVLRVGVKRDRIHIIANGIETERHAFSSEVRKKARQELGIGDDECLIGAVGNLYEVKGHRYLVEAFSGIQDRVANARLVIAGRGREEAALLDLIRRSGLQDRVSLLGFREDVPALLQAMDIFVMPSISEGLPLSVLEAMASRTPVIATSVGGLPQLIDHGKTGLLVPSRDAVALRQALLSFLEKQSLMENIARRAESMVRGKYSIASMIFAYEELYQKSGRK